jgi:hypothetical protein
VRIPSIEERVEPGIYQPNHPGGAVWQIMPDSAPEPAGCFQNRLVSPFPGLTGEAWRLASLVCPFNEVEAVEHLELHLLRRRNVRYRILRIALFEGGYVFRVNGTSTHCRAISSLSDGVLTVEGLASKWPLPAFADYKGWRGLLH